MEIEKELNKVICSFKGHEPINYIELINKLNEFDNNLDMSFQYWNRTNKTIKINNEVLKNVKKIIQYPFNEKTRDTAFRIVLKDGNNLNYWSDNIFEFEIV